VGVGVGAWWSGWPISSASTTAPVELAQIDVVERRGDGDGRKLHGYGGNDATSVTIERRNGRIIVPRAVLQKSVIHKYLCACGGSDEERADGNATASHGRVMTGAGGNTKGGCGGDGAEVDTELDDATNAAHTATRSVVNVTEATNEATAAATTMAAVTAEVDPVQPRVGTFAGAATAAKAKAKACKCREAWIFNGIAVSSGSAPAGDCWLFPLFTLTSTTIYFAQFAYFRQQPIRCLPGGTSRALPTRARVLTHIHEQLAHAIASDGTS
jgi:hypothetical protein